MIHCSRQNHDRFHRSIEIRRTQVAAAIETTVDSAENPESALKPSEKEDENPIVARRIYVPVQEDLTGVYGAFTYSWRCLFMSFDYQDWVDPIVFYGFYVENVLVIGFSFMVIHSIEYDLSDNVTFYVYTVAAGVGMLFAIIIKWAMVRVLKKRLTKRLAESAEKSRF